MPIFFFDTAEDGNEVRDEVGIDLDPQSVEKLALAGMSDRVCELLPEGRIQEFCLKVRDEEGNQIFKVLLTCQTVRSIDND